MGLTGGHPKKFCMFLAAALLIMWRFTVKPFGVSAPGEREVNLKRKKLATAEDGSRHYHIELFYALFSSNRKDRQNSGRYCLHSVVDQFAER